MCIIVYKQAGTKLPPYETLKTCYQNNPDGVGCMKRDKNGNITTFKGLLSFDKFYKRVKKLDSINADIALHFRIATRGGVTPQNCHPFKIKNNAYFMHNGTFTGWGFDDSESDTAQFSRLLSRLADNSITDNTAAVKLTNLALEWGAALIMDNKGVAMCGEWEEDNGVYYSNRSYLPYDNRYFYTPHDLPKYGACEACPYALECEEWGAACLSESEANEFIKQELNGLAV